MTDPNCNKCRNQKAKCIFFLIEVCYERKTHRFCAWRGENAHLSWLCGPVFWSLYSCWNPKKPDTLDYALNKRREEGDYSISHNFMEDGIVVIDPKTNCSAQGTLDFLTNVLHQKLLESNKGMDFLKHIFKTNPNHLGRTWKQLYPSTGGDRIKKFHGHKPFLACVCIWNNAFSQIYILHARLT